MSSQKTRNFGTAGGAEEAAREDAAPAKTESLARGSSNMSIEPGVVLSGKYWIDRVLAHGGMGIVVAARHLQLDERVAIKFLRDEIVSDADAAARFAREARTAIKIKSEHVARVIDVDSLENGAPFMVMEYLQGEDLAAWIRSRGPLPLEQAVEFVLQACEAIAEAHGLGIVHRDLKPANLFVSRRADGIFAVKVLDFGISKVAMGAADDPGVTTKNAVIGSPSYMSPEQLASSTDVDARSDIWALGVTLFEMLTGRMPFDADTTPLLCGKILRDPPPLLREFRAEVPSEVEAIVSRCLEKERADRFPTVGDLAMALAPFGPERCRASAARVWRTVQAAGLPSGVAEEAATSDRSSLRDQSGHATRVAWNQPADGPPPKRRRAVLVGVAALVTIGVGAVLYRSAGSPGAHVAEVPSDREPRPAAEPIVPAASIPPAASIQPAPAEVQTAAVPSNAPAKAPFAGKRGPRSASPNPRASGLAAPGVKPSSVFDSRD